MRSQTQEGKNNLEGYLGLKLPGKVKAFMWRTCKNILPTNYFLRCRKVSMVDECVLCGKIESSGHALWDGWMVEAVWKEIELLLPRLSHPHHKFIDVFWKIWED